MITNWREIIIMSGSQGPYSLFMTWALGICSCVTKAAGSMSNTGAHLTFSQKVSSTRQTEDSLSTLIFRNVPEDAQGVGWGWGGKKDYSDTR